MFDSMFNSLLATRADEEVLLPDVEYSAFSALLTFLYTDDVEINAEIVMTTLLVTLSLFFHRKTILLIIYFILVA